MFYYAQREQNIAVNYSALAAKSLRLTKENCGRSPLQQQKKRCRF